ncbi:MAG: peptide/nickel transport system permease protein [Acidimicrobiaceae bacterium]|jgi:peptide/nickel transport system permease protein
MELELLGAPEPAASTQWALFWRRFLRHRMAVISALVLIVLFVVCFGAQWVAPYEKNHQNLLIGAVGPSGAHWFGTDELGRDQLTEILYAGQISLKIGLSVALIATVVGTWLGALAGFFGRLPEQVLMRITDLFLVVPSIAILAIAIKKFGSDSTTIVLILAALGWMYIARVVRGQVLSIKEKEFVDAARASGASSGRIIARHILPNVVGPILVNATLGIAAAIVTESTLSFLGFGVQPPTTSWGRMLSDARGTVGTNKAHLIYFPGLALLVTVLAVNFIGDGLRDAFDPQSRR